MVHEEPRTWQKRTREELQLQGTSHHLIIWRIQSFLRIKRVDKFDLIILLEGKKNIDEDFVENLDVI